MQFILCLLATVTNKYAAVGRNSLLMIETQSPVRVSRILHLQATPNNMSYNIEKNVQALYIICCQN